MNRALILVVAIMLLGAASSSAHAFDKKRQGFLIGLGIGAHTSELTYKSNFAPASLDTQKELAVAFQIGYGFNDQFVAYFGGKGGSVGINGREATLTVAGFGAAYYFSRSTPSWYVTGLIGEGSVAIDDEDDKFTDTGNGWSAGIGYEITDRLHLEVSHARATLQDPINSTNKFKLQSSFATLQYLWY